MITMVRQQPSDTVLCSSVLTLVFSHTGACEPLKGGITSTPGSFLPCKLQTPTSMAGHLTYLLREDHTSASPTKTLHSSDMDRFLIIS